MPAALRPVMDFKVRTEHEAVWASEAVWKLWERDKSLAAAGEANWFRS